MVIRNIFRIESQLVLGEVAEMLNLLIIQLDILLGWQRGTNEFRFD